MNNKNASTKKNVSVSGTGLSLPAFLKTEWFIVILLFALVVAVFSPFIFSDSDSMLVASDQLQGLDGKVLMQSSLWHFHQFPMWQSSRLGGMPTIDAMFGDALYVPSLIISAVFPIHKAIGMKMIFHIFLAGVFFFLLLRKGFGISRAVSFIGAVLYMLNPEFVSHLYPGHDGKMYVIAWLPFIMWRLKVLMESPKFLNASLLSLGIAMALYTSHTQMTYFVLWGAFLYWVMAIILHFKSGSPRKTIYLSMAWFWVAVFAGIGLAAIQFFPSFMYINQGFSVRGAERGFDYAASWSMHWPEALSMWVPDFVGNTWTHKSLQTYWGANPFKLNTEYAGEIVVLLSVLAIALKPGAWRIFWGSVAAGALFYSLGSHTPVFHIAYYLVPGVKKFRAPSMIMFWFSFATALLSALCMKDFVKGAFVNFDENKRKNWNKGILIGMAAATGLALLFSLHGFVAGIAQMFIDDRSKTEIFERNFPNFVVSLWLWWFFAEAILLSVWGLLNGKISVNVVLAVILVAGFIDVTRIDERFVATASSRPYFYVEDAVKTLQEKMAVEPFRVFALPGAMAQDQNGEGVVGLEGVSGFHDNELRWYREFRGDQSDRNYLQGLIGFSNGQAYLMGDKLGQGNDFLDIANVKYLLVRDQSGTLLPVENKNALGRVSFVSRYVVLDSSRIASALQAGQYDPATTVALEKEPAFKPSPDSAVSPEFSAQWEKYTPDFRSVKVSTGKDGFLRISEVYYPGWEIRVDGTRVPVLKADLSWMAIPIKAGTHTVVMIPHSQYIGKVVWVTVAIAVIFLGLWIFSFAKYVSGKRDAPGTN